MDRTRLRARQLNRERARLGPAGELNLLRFDGKDADPQYVSLKTYAANETVNGWLAERIKGRDGGIYTQLTIADVDGEMAELMQGEGRPKHFALEGHVFNLDEDRTFKPIAAPMLWTFEGNETREIYP
jgi:hypothetical protein